MDDIIETTPQGGTYEAPSVTREPLDAAGSYVSVRTPAKQPLATAESMADGSFEPTGTQSPPVG